MTLEMRNFDGNTGGKDMKLKVLIFSLIQKCEENMIFESKLG